MNLTEDLPLVATDSRNPSIPESRIRDAQAGHSIYRRLEKDDETARIKRANLEYMIDGGAPYDASVLRDAGRGDDTNINFMEAKAEEDAAAAPYVEMTTMTDVYWRVGSGYGDQSEKVRYGKIISEGLTRMARRWGEDFTHNKLGLAQEFTRNGLGFVYWKDELDWRWESDGLNEFRLPRDTPSKPSKISYCTCRKSMGVEELYSYIRNEDAARKVGRWNVQAVKHTILTANTNSANRYDEHGWMDFVKEARENDIGIGSHYNKIPVYHLWVREFNGEISHYIGLQSGPVTDGDNMIGNGFLYQHRFRFKSIDQCIVPFPYGVGTHRTYHTIRGQGELSFDTIQISNQARCRMIDSVNASTSIVMQAETPNEMESAAYVQRGAFLIVSSGSKIQPTAMPDVSDRVLPVLRDMQMLRQNNTGSFQSRAVKENASDERTKYEVQAQQNQQGRLSSAAMTLFLGPWGTVGREMLRRALNPKLREDDPGGKEAFEFRAWCMKRGVPPEALKFDAIEEVVAARPIGNGSPESAQYAAEQVYSKSGGFDEVGRKEALRDVIASIPGVGYDNVDRYVGPDEPRTTMDHEIADLENNDFRNGQPVEVRNTQNHFVHAEIHAGLVQETVMAFEEQQIGAEELVRILRPALENLQGHSAYMDMDDTRVQEAAMLRKFITNNNGTLQQQEQHLIAQAREQQSQQAAPEMSPQDAIAMERGRMELEQQALKMQMEQQAFNQKLAIQEAEAQQKLQMRDLDKALKIQQRTL